ncbi:Paraquat-inducible protein A [Sodalis glossinidius str. 'morsitans']|uniref:Paraquat-inducible protein A n=1 Tax=Sodalis glossinidius (strain morsitans) TaxID=343509 RepID=Q2NU78_SODGM|nr:membrane integrity-associated transporter subunit PqiA [Sodalis glossinidius]BAE74297.1 paraquat-inducible protein A [Sodalis glossinidius str. 'morsitans']CRL44895.1 Paraquat-inducible protein A [Sodalis glossinidius str. 'morsitans']
MCDYPRQQHPVLCPHCDLLVALPPLAPGQKGSCPRCRNTLQNYWPDPKRQPVGFAISALVMQGLANLFPFINMEVSGLKRQITLPQIPLVMVSDHFTSLAGVFLLCVQAIPALCMIMTILLCMGVPLPFRLKAFLAKLLFALRSWGMAEIFLVGVLVSFVKLMAYGQIGIGNSFIPFCFFCLLQLRALQCVDPRWLWNVIMPYTSPVKRFQPGQGGLAQGLRACSCCTLILPADTVACPRCHTREGARRSNSLQWTLALLLTSLMLYIPANLLPIMITDGLGNRLNSTIMAGVILLWEDGSIPVALVIFIASIMVPSLKMIALGWLCWDAAGNGERKAADSERMHLLYEVVEFVGRWSMIDVFVIAVLSGLVRMGRLMSISPGIGVLLFAAVVILTMIAAKTFDPRLLWDRAVQNTLKGVDR